MYTVSAHCKLLIIMMMMMAMIQSVCMCGFVVEMVCETRRARLCYLHTSHVLGHRWHGVPAMSGCPPVINVNTRKVEHAVRLQLRHWNATGNSAKYTPDIYLQKRVL